MRLPRSLNISGYTLKIEYRNKIVVHGEKCFGVYDSTKKTIYLIKGMPPVRKKEIFLHEYLHFLEDIYRIGITDDNISCFALGILQLITNKKIKWIE